jgi:two-component system, chemotaxis family, sensor kinase CheA
MTESFDIGADREVFLGFVEESLESLDAINPLILSLETNSENSNLINKIFRVMHSLKGNAPFFGLVNVKKLAHKLEDLLAAVRDKSIKISPELVNHILKGTDELRAIILRAKDNHSEIKDVVLFESLINYSAELLDTCKEAGKSSWDELNSLLFPLMELLPAEKDRFSKINTLISKLSGKEVLASKHIKEVVVTNKEPPPLDTLETESKEEKPTHNGEQVLQPVIKESGKTMRVLEERIDTFLSFVGELIIAGETFRHLIGRLEISEAPGDLKKDFLSLNEAFSMTFNGLEKAIMSIRKVPIKTLLNKVPRIIRDVSNTKNKQVKVVIQGEDSEVDKSLLELLDAPLVHMARNAADHGIELPDVRIKAGKTPQGTVTINCKEEDKFFVIEISDDGAGLNYEALKSKAIALGVISSNQQLSQKDVINLIFEAGVSTATEVSDVSGRGVGMDVVRNSVESAGGKITVKSEQSIGSTFTLSVPKSITTQIIDGFIVKANSGYYVFPLEKIHETWLVQKSDIHRTPSGVGFISRHEKILPYLTFSELLGLNSSPNLEEESLAITLQHQGVLHVVAIESVLGQRQLVLKELDVFSNKSQIYSGATLLGSGEIALVLNLDKVLPGQVMH